MKAAYSIDRDSKGRQFIRFTLQGDYDRPGAAKRLSPELDTVRVVLGQEKIRRLVFDLQDVEFIDEESHITAIAEIHSVLAGWANAHNVPLEVLDKHKKRSRLIAERSKYML